MVFRLFLTNECQCNCFYCSQHVREGLGEFLPAEHAEALAQTAFQLGYDTIELTGGEPLLHPEFAKILKNIASADQCKKVILCTNGILLEKHLPEIKNTGITELKIHIDTVLAQEYKNITGCSEVLNHILFGLWQAFASGLKVDIVTKLHEYSEQQLGQILSLAKTHPVNIAVETMATCKEKYTEEKLLLRWKPVIGEPVQLREHIYSAKGWKGTFSFTDQNE